MPRPTRPTKNQSGVHGHANAILGGNTNLSANDGTITRFGWKAQNKSLLMFAGEAYNVEMGISNQLFPQERDENRRLPHLRIDAGRYPTTCRRRSPRVAMSVLSDIEAFANFMRMLAPPVPAADAPSTLNGKRAIRQHRLRSLPYARLHHRAGGGQRIVRESQPGAFESAG